MSFAEIPIRRNCTDIEASWFNAIRDKLLALDDLGLDFQRSALVLGDNALPNLTEISALTNAGAVINYQIHRVSLGSPQLAVLQSGTFTLMYNIISQQWEKYGDDININGDAKCIFKIVQDGVNLVDVLCEVLELVDSPEDEVGTITIRRELWPRWDLF
jgi:hypothetical protein